MELIVLMPIDLRHIPTHHHLNGRIRRDRIWRVTRQPTRLQGGQQGPPTGILAW